MVFCSLSGCVVTRLAEDNCRILETHHTQMVNVGLPPTLLWKSGAQESHIVQTATLPIELEVIIQGYCECSARSMPALTQSI